MQQLTDRQTTELNNYSALASYQYTWIGNKFMNCPLDVLAVFFGNQAGKGAMVVINYILRILGCHPVAQKNVLYYQCENAIKYDEAERKDKDLTEIERGHYYSPKNVVDMKFGVDPYIALYSDKYICPECSTKLTPHIRQGAHRVIRFASQTMPGSESAAKGKGSGREANTETKNTQFIELMKWMPAHLLRDKKISVRDATLRVLDPFPTGMDIVIEFVSFGQVVQSSAGVQRMSNWLDELPSKEFFDEQVPRMLAVDNSDIILSYTVTKDVGYLFDLIWSRGRWIYRSKSIVKHFKEKKNEIIPMVEETDSEFKNIAVFHGSTFDNPTLKPSRVREMMKLLHDDCTDNEDVMDMRLYCLFKEISAYIFPSFNMRTHVIDPSRYFTAEGEIILN